MTTLGTCNVYILILFIIDPRNSELLHFAKVYRTSTFIYSSVPSRLKFLS